MARVHFVLQRGSTEDLSYDKDTHRRVPLCGIDRSNVDTKWYGPPDPLEISFNPAVMGIELKL